MYEVVSYIVAKAYDYAYKMISLWVIFVASFVLFVLILVIGWLIYCNLNGQFKNRVLRNVHEYTYSNELLITLFYSYITYSKNPSDENYDSVMSLVEELASALDQPKLLELFEEKLRAGSRQKQRRLNQDIDSLFVKSKGQIGKALSRLDSYLRRASENVIMRMNPSEERRLVKNIVRSMLRFSSLKM